MFLYLLSRFSGHSSFCINCHCFDYLKQILGEYLRQYNVFVRCSDVRCWSDALASLCIRFPWLHYSALPSHPHSHSTDGTLSGSQCGPAAEARNRRIFWAGLGVSRELGPPWLLRSFRKKDRDLIYSFLNNNNNNN